jgi:hypothetical protein
MAPEQSGASSSIRKRRKESLGTERGNVASITFPYASFEQALTDNFSKIGGREGAFSLMSNGFKQGIWRKGANEKRQDKIKTAVAYYDASLKKKGGDLADRQLKAAKSASE